MNISKLIVKQNKKYVNKQKDERKREKEIAMKRYMIRICKVYEASPKKQCNRASIEIHQ